MDENTWSGAERAGGRESHPAVLLHLQQDLLVLLGDGQRGRVHPLVDLLPLARLEGVQPLPAVTHPVPNTHTHTDTQRGGNRTKAP